MKKTVSWGIIGTGSIANLFAQDIAYTKHCRLQAVASRTPEKTKAFASQYNVPAAYSSYEKLANDPAVDAVYVATPHPFHLENTLTAINAGKAVLCEKPFAMDAKQARTMIEAAAKKGVFLMEGMWTRFLRAAIRLREWLDDKRIGEVLSLQADFCIAFGAGPKHRINNPDLGGGALLDLGIYAVSFASMVFGTQPAKILAAAHNGKTGVDDQDAIIFQYENGATAMLSCSSRHWIVPQGRIAGTTGSIVIPPKFYSPAKLIFQPETKPEKTYDFPYHGYGLAYEADHVASCLMDKKLHSDIMPLEETLAIMETMDKIKKATRR